MPKLTKEFYHADIDTTCDSMYPIKTRTEEALDVMYTHKGATDVFYADLKELLAQCEELNPTFNDEEKSFTIFDSKFYLRCLNTVNAPYYSYANQEYCVRPFLFKEGYEYRNPPQKANVSASRGYNANNQSFIYYDNLNCDNKQGNRSYNVFFYDDYFNQGMIRNFNGAIFFYHSSYNSNMTGSYCPSSNDNREYFYSRRPEADSSNNKSYNNYGYTYPGTQYARFGYDSSATIIKFNSRTIAKYIIEIYYNTNWIQILYKSSNNEKFSLGFFFVGKFINPYTQEEEELLFTQQDGSNCSGKQSGYMFDNNVYMSNYIHGGYSGVSNSSNNGALSKIKHIGNDSSSGYYASQVSWQQIMFFKKGHLTNVLEELGLDSFYYSDNPKAYMNPYISSDVYQNDFQLYNLTLSNIYIPIKQRDFGYLTPLGTKFFKAPLTVLSGMVKFDNIIYGQIQPTSSGPHKYQYFDSDTVYDIGDETYYCPFSVNRNYYSTNTDVDILLKL